MDLENTNVFESNITRNLRKLKNNLRDILDINLATPVPVNKVVNETCTFRPVNDKIYVPKKKNRVKVKTVRDIRNLYEKDIYTTLPHDLEKQKKMLLRKIKGGCAKEENTKAIALNFLKSDNPVSRTSWQMIMNINPEGQPYPFQHILWHGKCIQVNGSRGGRTKFIFNYDIGKSKESFKNKKCTNKRGCLLRDSLNIKFKPGPLKKKGNLDNSYQKYNIGNINVIKLPNLGLDIQPTYGVALEPAIANFLHNLRDTDGIISEKWAQFAVSIIGEVKNKDINIKSEDCVTFNLNYKCGQNRILMRRDYDNLYNINSLNLTLDPSIKSNDSSIITVVQDIVDRMIDTTEISLQQDLLYSGKEDLSIISVQECSNDCESLVKDKMKRKYCELDRLDVTIIRVSENRLSSISERCTKPYCSLGCICRSLECGYNLKQHCGQVECMFDCKCGFSKNQLTESLENDCSDFMAGLLHLNRKNNLAKEEQKFHQTVIVTDEKRIILKSKRRHCKPAKKYAEFYSSINSRSGNKRKKLLSVVDIKLNCDHIESWCMVHNLYKCFCKGKFIQSVTNDFSSIESNAKISAVDEAESKENKMKQSDDPVITEISEKYEPKLNILEEDIIDYENSKCVRILPYKGRKYSDRYYHRTNAKILKMEENDTSLYNKMISLMNGSESKDNDLKVENMNATNKSNVKNDLQNILEEQNKLMKSMSVDFGTLTQTVAKRLTDKIKLVKWLELSYKKYKEGIDHGIVKTSLSPPKAGKVALYPWEFILERYQERKNLFLVSIQKPYRIFMAVDANNVFFNNCIDIKNISLQEIVNFPLTVQKLVNNDRSLKDNFCILCGLPHCWELIGSVTKVNENKSNKSDSQSDDFTQESSSLISSVNENVLSEYEQRIYTDQFKNSLTELDSHNQEAKDCNAQFSKWFVMNIENDFAEIQFYKKGFFVKYESIIKAIEVARKAKKTVRLSLQKCNDESNRLQFGIYAIPNVSKNSVFVGPYDKGEPLGIETIKNSSSSINKNKTRGVWITVNTIDNSKVIDNPLLLMPSNKNNCDDMVPLEPYIDSKVNIDKRRLESKENAESVKDNPTKKLVNEKNPIKLVKPIKIRKTNGFYHLSSNSLLKPFAFGKRTQIWNQHNNGESGSSSNSPLKISTSWPCRPLKVYTQPVADNEPIKTPLLEKSVVEKTPQIKIKDVVSLQNNTKRKESISTRDKTDVGGMSILKPEEINRRIESQFFNIMNDTEIKDNNEMSMLNNGQGLDLETIIDTSITCSSQDSEVFEISDDEDNFSASSNATGNVWKNVWILCKNVENVGWIQGRRNSKNELSFEFPGFKFSNFYQENEAFAKINQIFSRKVYVPRNVIMEWKVIETEAEIARKHKLEMKHLGSDFVMTKQALRNKNDLIAMLGFNTSDNSTNTNIPATTNLDKENSTGSL